MFMSAPAAQSHVTLQPSEEQQVCSLKGKLVNRPKRVELCSGGGAEVTGSTDPENDLEAGLFVRQSSYNRFQSSSTEKIQKAFRSILTPILFQLFVLLKY